MHFYVGVISVVLDFFLGVVDFFGEVDGVVVGFAAGLDNGGYEDVVVVVVVGLAAGAGVVVGLAAGAGVVVGIEAGYVVEVG